MTQTAASPASPPTSDCAVSFSRVTKSYGGVHAVNGLDLDIARGETVALLGPNGAGKSTIVTMMLGLLPHDGGDIRLFGRSPAEAARAGQVGGMLQEGGLIPRVTVRELIEFMRGTYETPLPLSEILETAQLTTLANRRVDKLSGGQAQRVRFALAFTGDPDLIVLDEPTAALDVESRRDLWTTMAAYAAHGNTLLFSTHYLGEADDYAERIVVVAGGRVLADGTGAELKRSVSGKTVSIDVRDTDVGELSKVPGVSRVEVRGARAHLSSTDADLTVTALARTGALRNVEVTGGGLEDAFLALTNPALTNGSHADHSRSVS